jgi:hypothetical protein
MRQALTAKGQLDVWMRSTEAALTNMGFEDIAVDEASLHISGHHPEKGPIGIDYMTPEAGKTRMVIQVDDSFLIDEYKHQVAPIFKRVMDELEAAKAEEQTLQAAKADESAEESTEPEPDADSEVDSETPLPNELETWTNDGQTDQSEEKQPAEDRWQEAPLSPKADAQSETQDNLNTPYRGAPISEGKDQAAEKADKASKPPKKKKRWLLPVILIVIIALASAGAFAYYRHQQSTSGNSQSKTQTSSKAKSDQSSSEDTKSDNDNTADDNTSNDNTNNNATTATTVTLAQYNAITTGMTYDQVKQQFSNVDGQKLSESTYKDQSNNDIKTEVYYWNGNGDSGSNASITFANGAVSQKSQFGLK